MLITCVRCRKVYEVPVTEQQLAAWNAGMLIQRAMPNLPPAQRELLMTHICGICFDALFNSHDDEVDDGGDGTEVPGFLG
jgi:hypothetical protein